MRSTRLSIAGVVFMIASASILTALILCCIALAFKSMY